MRFGNDAEFGARLFLATASSVAVDSAGHPYIGGFLGRASRRVYDRMMAGWEVTVLLPDGFDTRPLRILGVRTSDLQAELAPEFASVATSQSLVVSAEAFSSDARVRDRVLDAMDRPSTEVALWGDGWPLRINRGMTRAQHVLSSGARVFKGYALAAAGISCDAVDPTETLLCDLSACLPVESELIRLG